MDFIKNFKNAIWFNKFRFILSIFLFLIGFIFMLLNGDPRLTTIKSIFTGVVCLISYLGSIVAFPILKSADKSKIMGIIALIIIFFVSFITMLLSLIFICFEIHEVTLFKLLLNTVLVFVTVFFNCYLLCKVFEAIPYIKNLFSKYSPPTNSASEFKQQLKRISVFAGAFATFITAAYTIFDKLRSFLSFLS